MFCIRNSFWVVQSKLAANLFQIALKTKISTLTTIDYFDLDGFRFT